AEDEVERTVEAAGESEVLSVLLGLGVEIQCEQGGNGAIAIDEILEVAVQIGGDGGQGERSDLLIQCEIPAVAGDIDRSGPVVSGFVDSQRLSSEGVHARIDARNFRARRRWG